MGAVVSSMNLADRPARSCSSRARWPPVPISVSAKHQVGIGKVSEVKVKAHIQRLFVVNHHRRIAQVWHVFSRDFRVLPAHPHVHPQSEWAIPAFAFPAIVGTHLPYRPRRDGRLSRPWCEVAQAEIRTRNLQIANLTLYHTATSHSRSS